MPISVLSVLTALWLAIGGCALPAAAQSPAPDATAPAATAPAPPEIEALLRTLKDDAERQKLVSQLELMLDARRAGQAEPAPDQGFGARALAGLSERVERTSRDLVVAMRTVFDLGRLGDWIAQQAGNPDTRDRWLTLLWKVSLVVAVGLIAAWLAGRLLARPRGGLEGRGVGSVWGRALALVGRTVLELVPVGLFVAAGYVALTLVAPDSTARLVSLALIHAYALAGLLFVAGRMVLAPAAGNLRIAPLGDDDANYLYVWLRRIVNVAVYGYVAAHTAPLLGLPPGGAGTLLHIVGLFVALMLVVFVLQNRAAVAGWLHARTAAGGPLRVLIARLADIWHVLAIVYIAGMYVVWALRIPGGFRFVLQATVLTVLIVIAGRIAVGVIQRAARRVFALSDEMRQRHPELEARANRYLPILERFGSLVVWVIAVFATLQAWGIASLDLLASDLGQRFAGALATSLIVVVATVAAWEMANAWIARYLARGGAGGAAVSARVRTLLPLLRTTLLVVLATLATLVVLSEFGVNIAPLLAGAGVIGLAVGFGSQTLVKDVITGVFILAEDQLAVGDVVRVGSYSGLVERLTLRTIWLRGMDGTVQILPFSEVQTVQNMTKDFSRYVFDVGVAYREDTDEVVKVLEEIGAGMAEDPAYKDLIVSPLEVMGVDSFGDNAVVIKARITTQPIQQWKVGREFNRRMKKRFDELGIEIPFPHRTIYFGVDKAGNAPPARLALDGAAKAAAPGADDATGPMPAGAAPAGGGASAETPRS